MAARPVSNTASRRPLLPKVEECAVASGPRPEALIVLIAVAVILMMGPPLIAALSILDPNLFEGSGGWARMVSTGLSYLIYSGTFLALPLIAMVAPAKEDS